MKKIIIVTTLFFYNISFGQSGIQFQQKKDSVFINYQNSRIFHGRLSGDINQNRIKKQLQTVEGATYYIVTITAGDFKNLELTGKVEESSESIACESEPKDNGLKIVTI